MEFRSLIQVKEKIKIEERHPFMKKMKKIVIMLMIAVIAITVIPFNFSSASTNHGSSLITNVTLDKTTADLGERIQVNYNWAIPDGTVKAGDTMIVKMPRIVPNGINRQSTQAITKTNQ